MKLDKKKLKFYKKELENFKKHGVKISEGYSYNLSNNQEKAITVAIKAIDENIKLKKQIKELKKLKDEIKGHEG
jgi:hypothetical protein